VDGDVAGVCLGLLTGHQLLAGVLHSAGGFPFTRRELRLLFEEDLLLAKLILDVALGEIRLVLQH
jgi:hypothetical protein